MIMQNKSTNAVMSTQLELLEKKIFWACPIKEVIRDQYEMYTAFMCSDAAEDTGFRNQITATHQTTMKLLGCVQTHIDPDGEVCIQFTIE
jgi:hypothetical protein